MIETYHFRVEWGECDPATIVFYPRYFAWFDEATASLMRIAGLPIIELRRRFGIVGLPAVSVGADFKSPLTWGEEARVLTGIERIGRASIALRHRVAKGDTTIAEGREIRVWASQGATEGTLATSPIPAEVVAGLKPFVIGA